MNKNTRHLLFNWIKEKYEHQFFKTFPPKGTYPFKGQQTIGDPLRYYSSTFKRHSRNFPRACETIREIFRHPAFRTPPRSVAAGVRALLRAPAREGVRMTAFAWIALTVVIVALVWLCGLLFVAFFILPKICKLIDRRSDPYRTLLGRDDDDEHDDWSPMPTG